MTKRQFLKEYRDEIDNLIRTTVDNPTLRINDHERELWVANDEYLYRLARRKGVKV